MKTDSAVHFVRRVLAALALVPLACAQTPPARVSYTAESIVNSASNMPGALAPNTIATVYGTGLSYSTQCGFYPMHSTGMMQTELAGAKVFVGAMAAPLYYVSPTQISFLVPTELRPGDMDFFTTHDSLAGPHVRITVVDASPSLYPSGPGMIASTHTDGTVITRANPAHPGEMVVLYATGLGRTDPELQTGTIELIAAQIRLLSELTVTVAGVALDNRNIQYAGVTPGTPGVYQVNLVLPKELAPDPEIRISIGAQTSSSGMRLPVH